MRGLALVVFILFWQGSYPTWCHHTGIINNSGLNLSPTSYSCPVLLRLVGASISVALICWCPGHNTPEPQVLAPDLCDCSGNPFQVWIAMPTKRGVVKMKGVALFSINKTNTACQTCQTTGAAECFADYKLVDHLFQNSTSMWSLQEAVFIHLAAIISHWGASLFILVPPPRVH